MLVLNKNKIKYLKKFDLISSTDRCQDCPMDIESFANFLKENKVNENAIKYWKEATCKDRFYFLVFNKRLLLGYIDDFCSDRKEILQELVDNYIDISSIIKNE